MLRHVRWSLPRAASLVAAPLLLLAACGDDDDPVAPVATLPVAAQVLDSAAATIAPLGAHPLFSGLLGAWFVPGLPYEFGDPFVPPALRGDLGVDGPPTRPVAQLGGIFEVDASLRGRTFVEDTMSFSTRWRVDTLANGTPRPGAPADGVRFILTSMDFVEPREVVGHLDVVPGAGGTLLTVEGFDAAGERVLRHVGDISLTGSGFVEVGNARVDQATTGGIANMRTRFTGAGTLALAATRAATYARNGESVDYLNTVRVGGHELAVATREVDSDTDVAITYTVLVDGAPFARMRTTLIGGSAEWRHVGADRALTAEEERQVEALVRLLRLLPDSSLAWEEGLFNLFMVEAP